MSDQIFYLFSAVLLGAVFGALIMYFASGTNKDSEKTIAKLEKELASYQQDVAEHFEQTADLVDDMTQSYKKVFDHLGKSARKLMTEEQIQQQLELRKGTKVTLEYLTEAEEKQNESHEVKPELTDEDVAVSEPVTTGQESLELSNTGSISGESTSSDQINSEETSSDSEDNEVEVEVVENQDIESKEQNDELVQADDETIQNEEDDEINLEKEVEIREKNIYS